jgi:hypothetical protein
MSTSNPEIPHPSRRMETDAQMLTRLMDAAGMTRIGDRPYDHVPSAQTPDWGITAPPPPAPVDTPYFGTRRPQHIDDTGPQAPLILDLHTERPRSHRRTNRVGRFVGALMATAAATTGFIALLDVVGQRSAH